MTTMSNFAWHEAGCTCLYPVQFGHDHDPGRTVYGNGPDEWRPNPRCKFVGCDPHQIPEGFTVEWVEAVEAYYRQLIERFHDSPEQVEARRKFAEGLWNAKPEDIKLDVYEGRVSLKARKR